MKSESNINLKMLILLGYVLFLPTLTFFNSDFSTLNRITCINGYFDCKSITYNLRISGTSDIIHINNNWTATQIAGICTGNGTYQDPYIIKNLQITTFPDTGILIENSNAYLLIENCSIGHAADPNAGIKLVNVNNSRLINNDCSQNYHGIDLTNCYNNTILGNKASDEEHFGYTTHAGIFLNNCHNNIIQDNYANFTGNLGIGLYRCSNNFVLGNTANSQESGDGIFLRESDNNVVSKNIVNENGITCLVMFDVRSDSGIVVVDSNNNIISDNIANGNSLSGIHLYSSENNKIIGNTIRNNYYGVYLRKGSNNNIVSDNIISENSQCIEEDGCNANIYWNNGLCVYIGTPFFQIMVYGGIALLIISICVLLEIIRRKTHKF